MKISQLINEIVQAASAEFFTDNDQCNNNPSVGIFSDNGNWQVWLQRPSSEQLARGEVKAGNTVKLWEGERAFWTESSTLLGALSDLCDKVSQANNWDEIIELEEGDE